MKAGLASAAALLCCLAGGGVHAQQAGAAAAVVVTPVETPSTTQLAAATVSPQVRAPAPAAPAQPAAGVPAGHLLQTIFALLAVLGLLAGLAWFLKRYGPHTGGGGPLRTVGALSLGGRERIIVVEVGDQWIVVGASPGRVNALATMPRQPIDAPAALLHPDARAAGSFSDWLKQTIEKRNAK